MIDVDAARTRQALIDGVLEFLSGQDLLTRVEIQSALEREVDAAGATALRQLRERLLIDSDWDYAPADPLARRIHHLLADRFLETESYVTGADSLQRLARQPLVIMANHLSYADANVIDVLLQRCGAGEVATRLTALAGPKVYLERNRRFSSLCFGTIKVPQSTEVSSEEAVLPSREVARAARKAISAAHDRLAMGDALVLFAEGTRSRTAAMRPLLAAAARYLERPGTWIVPVGLTGSEELFPIGDSTIRPCRVELRVGPPLSATTLLAASQGDRRLTMDAIGLAIAALLPARYRGAYADAGAFTDAGAVLARAEQPS